MNNSPEIIGLRLLDRINKNIQQQQFELIALMIHRYLYLFNSFKEVILGSYI